MKESLPTVYELNAIQKQWMELSPDAPPEVKKKVFKLMERYPKIYVSGHDGFGVCYVNSAPLSVPIEFEKALEMSRKHAGRTDVAWNGKLGQWYRL